MTDDALTPREWRLRTEVYRHFTETTRAPTVSDLVESTGESRSDVEAGLERLERQHQLTLAPGSSNVWMAHPFSAIPTEFPVDTARGRYWANCAWDMLAIPAMLGVDSHSATRCAETGVRVDVAVEDGRIAQGEGVVHFVVRPSDFWENVGYT